MSVFLETERLVLRSLSPDDVDAFVELEDDPEVMQFLTKGEPIPSDSDHWAAIEKETGELIGWFGLEPHGDEAQLGYRLRRSAWGKGYATEASRALIEKGFAELGYRRITAQTMAVNVRSRRVMEKLGMRHVRTFQLEFDDPLPGTELGEVEYEIRR